MTEHIDVSYRLSRRSLIAGAAALAVAGCASETTQPASDKPATGPTPITAIENDADLERALPSLSSWGGGVARIKLGR